MALSKIGLSYVNKDADSDSLQDSENGVKCGICGSSFQIPKSLKCLHSFCLNCLREKSNAGENNVACPACNEITQLPSKGVEGLNTNYMLVEKQERHILTEQLKNKDAAIPCTYCDHGTDSKDNKASSWCRQCEEYMCEVALKNHKVLRKAKLHDIISIDKLRSGDIPSGCASQNERMCPKHRDEKLRFYCETCEEPFCRDCGVIDHPRNEDHAQVYLEDAVKKRQDDIQKAAEDCRRVAQEVEETLAQDERVETALQRAVTQALNEYDDAAKLTESRFSENRKQHRDKFSADLMQFDEKRNAEISEHKQKLRNVRSRIHSALLMANTLAVSGNQFDVADMYKNVITALRELREFQPVPERFSNVVFKSNDDSLSAVENLPALGKLKLGIWELKHDFGNEGDDGKLTAARGLAFTSTGDIVVADYTARNIKVYDGLGQYKNTQNPGFTYPFDIATMTDGSCCVTDTSTVVKKFNAEIVNISNHTSSGNLYGITPTKTDGWAACYQTENTIYVYDNAGNQISTISVMQPQYIAVTSKGDFVFSSVNQKSVQIVNAKGYLVQLIGPPDIVDNNSWEPYGVCCSPDDEVLVANRGEGSMGIFRFKSCGEYIDCITTEVNKPWGLAMSEDGDRLAVVDEDGACVKLFGLK